MSGLPTGLKYRLAQVLPTQYDDEGYSQFPLGHYRFESEPVDGKRWNVVIDRERFWFGDGGLSYDYTRPIGQLIARAELEAEARRAWGLNLPPAPEHDDDYPCGCGCDCRGGGW